MSKGARFVAYIANKPTETIESLLALGLVLTGLWLAGPLYAPDDSVTHRVTDSNTIPHVLGWFQIALAVPLVFALLKTSWPLRQKVRRTVTFIVFLLYLFYGFSQVLLWGTSRVWYVATFILAAIAGVCHLRLKWELSNDDGPSSG